MEKRRARLKWICYIAVILLLMLLETTVLRHVRILGSTPMALVPYAVGVIAMLEGAFGGAAAGLAAGIISDAMLAPNEGFYTIVLVLCGTLIGLLCNVIFWKTYPVTLMYVVINMLFISALYYVFFMLIFGQTNILPLLRGLPGEFLATLIFTPFVYLMLRGIYNRFRVYEES